MKTFSSLLAHSLALLFLQCAFSAELAHWTAARPDLPGAVHVRTDQKSAWHFEDAGGTRVARLKPGSDYWTRAAYEIDFVISPTGKVWLTLEFVDHGYGLITLQPGVSERKLSGVARVNSGKVRRAIFEYEAMPKSIRIEGLDYLGAVRLGETEPVREVAPLVAPAVKFARPSERVTSAGGDYSDPEQLPEALAGLRNQLPLIRAIGFNGVETYIRWGMVERQRGHYDWSYYDAIMDEIERHGLQCFPMLLAGSGYALPAWLYESTNNVGFKCLEHGIIHDTQTIFDPFQRQYASRFIAEFGRRYGERKALLGIRLGPSGDFGEAQYPAKGPGYRFRRDAHTHIGYWAADDLAQADFRAHLRTQYGTVEKLNEAWKGRFDSFDQLHTFLPETALTRRQRLDFANWYMGAMSEWCEQWAIWARAALPHAVIHQSSGGWGPVQIGTDYSYQARSMKQIGGGMRLTNEGDDFADNFTITRMASSAGRFYDIPLGYEPGGFGSKRGVMARLFNTITTGGVHLFYYLGNLTGNDQALAAWLKYATLLDQRARPVIDVAAFYPDTALKLDDELVRYRWASTFFTVGRTLREETDFDYASEQMILDGALDRYRVLLFLWGAITEQPVLERLDQWVHNGGTLVFAQSPRGLPMTVEGDSSIAQKWLAGNTGKGRVVLWRGELIPSRSYAEYVRDVILQTPGLRPELRAAMTMQKPSSVYWSVLENGKLALLNFSSRAATAKLANGKEVVIPPYEMALE